QARGPGVLARLARGAVAEAAPLRTHLACHRQGLGPIVFVFLHRLLAVSQQVMRYVGYAAAMHISRMLIASALLATTACSPRQMALNRMAAALADASVVYETDNDPEFVRLAAPSTLKTVEMLLSQSPRHPRLLLTACSGFTQYSYGFLHVESQ